MKKNGLLLGISPNPITPIYRANQPGFTASSSYLSKSNEDFFTKEDF